MATVRQRILAAIAALLAAGTAAPAQTAGQGAGPILGSALGVGWKGWVNDDYALATGLAWSLEGDDSVHLHADYLIHSAEAPRRLAFFRQLGGRGQFLAYYGAGVRVKLLEHNRLGARVPVGLAYAAGDAPWDAFIEIAPALDVVPEARWEAAAFTGWRWYFDPRPLDRSQP